jgi:hypothetical protein
VRAVVANSHGTVNPLGDDVERLELIDTALALVGPAPSAERAELLSLQAAELALGGDHERVLRAADEAAAIAARLDDVTIRARVGVRRLMACLVPDRVTALASEGIDLVGWADATGDPKLRVLSRRPPARLAAGALAEARRRTAEAMAIADETGQLELRAVATIYYATAIDALGEHQEAERLIQVGFELGQQAGFPEAMLWYVGQMLPHWTFEGQPEMVAVVAASASDAYPRVSALSGILALGMALSGRDEELAALLAGLPSVLPGMPVDLVWLSNHFLFAAAQGFGVENPKVAGARYDRLLPYRSLHAAYAVGYLGPIEVALAIAARVMGDNECALAHHEAAAVIIEACGAARALALNGYQHSVTLLARDAPGDRRRVIEMAEETLAYCRTKGYATFVGKTEELLATIGRRM